MIPSSEQLELFYEQLHNLHRMLGKLKGAEVRKPALVQEIRNIAKEWLRLSEALRSGGVLPHENLNLIDSRLKAVLQSSNARTRATAYQRKLDPVLDSFTECVVVPVIRFEGSPSQVASRQLLAEFAGKVSPEEQAYLEEAARCLASHCNRAAIIMLWAAGMARIHSAVQKRGFSAFNSALGQCMKKKAPFSRVANTPVNSLPELQHSRDFDLIIIGMELWRYDLQVFEELDRLLGTRNSAAHPGMLKPSALDVQQYASKVCACVFDNVHD